MSTTFNFASLSGSISPERPETEFIGTANCLNLGLHELKTQMSLQALFLSWTIHSSWTGTLFCKLYPKFPTVVTSALSSFHFELSKKKESEPSLDATSDVRLTAEIRKLLIKWWMQISETSQNRSAPEDHQHQSTVSKATEGDELELKCIATVYLACRQSSERLVLVYTRPAQPELRNAKSVWEQIVIIFCLHACECYTAIIAKF